MSLRKIYYALPPRGRFLARRLWYWPADFFRKLRRSSGAEIMPPRGMIYTGSGDFRRQGEVLVQQFQEFAGLQPGHRVLDIGSGIGRVALPLTRFLDPAAGGAYEGFDVVKTGVDWCGRNITARFPHFRFRYIPLKNDLYTEAGADAAGFSFPYPEADFDFACVISVFTHMLPAEVARYAEELHRCLRPGGRCFATFFLLKNEGDASANPGFAFPHRYGHYALMDAQVQAGNVAFEENWVRERLFPKEKFVVEGMYAGYWRGGVKEVALDFQDIIVVRKV